MRLAWSVEMARTQKNNATEHHLSLLQEKVTKPRAQLMELTKLKLFDFSLHLNCIPQRSMSHENGDTQVPLIGFRRKIFSPGL